jgi:DNA mismatch repair protein MutS2
LGTKGVVVEVPDKSGNAQIKAGILTTRVNVKDLKLVVEEATLTKDGKKNKVSTYSVQKNHDFKDEIDLRGMNGDEAWFAVDKYLDSAILYGFRTVRIIHGKGTGALRQAMQNFLRTDKRVASFRRGQYGEGDSGVTVVELK